MPSFFKYPVARTRAFIAWLTAPAPIACTSARWCSRTTPAIAPATADVREVAETLIMSMVSLQNSNLRFLTYSLLCDHFGRYKDRKGKPRLPAKQCIPDPLGRMLW